MSLVIPQEFAWLRKKKERCRREEKNLNKRLWPRGDGSEGDRCCENTDPKRHLGPGHASSWQSPFPLPRHCPGPVGCGVGDREASYLAPCQTS